MGNANPPFATSDGKPANQGTGGSGGRDMTTDYVDKAGGGPGMIAKDRPQSEASPEVVPNPQEIPPGGKWIPDVAPEGGPDTGNAVGVAGAPTPFKNLK